MKEDALTNIYTYILLNPNELKDHLEPKTRKNEARLYVKTSPTRDQ